MSTSRFASSPADKERINEDTDEAELELQPLIAAQPSRNKLRTLRFVLFWVGVGCAVCTIGVLLVLLLGGLGVEQVSIGVVGMRYCIVRPGLSFSSFNVLVVNLNIVSVVPCSVVSCRVV
jgi:hypothetical protein